jgi:hypothetical protein
MRVVLLTAKLAGGEVKLVAVLGDRKKETIRQFLERMAAAN